MHAIYLGFVQLETRSEDTVAACVNIVLYTLPTTTQLSEAIMVVLSSGRDVINSDTRSGRLHASYFFKSCLYFSLFTLPQVHAQLAGGGIAESHSLSTFSTNLGSSSDRFQVVSPMTLFAVAQDWWTAGIFPFDAIFSIINRLKNEGNDGQFLSVSLLQFYAIIRPQRHFAC